MDDQSKRELRRQKREQKRIGVKFMRRTLKRVLVDDPDEAPHVEPDFGRHSTAPLNGIDKDTTRARTKGQVP